MSDEQEKQNKRNSKHGTQISLALSFFEKNSNDEYICLLGDHRINGKKPSNFERERH